MTSGRSIKYLVLPIIAIILDQFIKSAVRTYFHRSGIAELTIIPGFLNLVDFYNPGGAFGILQRAPSLFLILSAIFAVVALFLMVKISKTDPLLSLGLGFVAGGALGNLMDRARWGMVYDFVDCHIGNYHWPAFNAADAFIVIGAGLLALSLLRGSKSTQKKSAQSADKD